MRKFTEILKLQFPDLFLKETGSANFTLKVSRSIKSHCCCTAADREDAVAIADAMGKAFAAIKKIKDDYCVRRTGKESSG